MSQREYQAQRKRRAATAIQVLILLPVLMGFATLTVDVGTIYNAKSDMQDIVDAAALAAIGVIAYADPDDGNLLSNAADAAMEYAARNSVLSGSVELDPVDDIIFGHAYFNDVANSYNFVPGDTPTNAVRIRIRHTEDSPNGRLPLFLAGAFGSNLADVSADATAIYTGTWYEKADCFDTVPAGSVMMCLHGDSDDSDDSEAGDSDDSDDSDTGDSDGSANGDPDDSDDSAAGDSDDSDDSNPFDSDSDSHTDSDIGDSESHDSSGDSDAGTTIILLETATPIYLKKGATMGPCNCDPGDSDDSDDSAAGDSGDSDDSDPGDSDGSTNGDSDDSDDSEAGDSDDSDDSSPGAIDSDSDSGVDSVDPPAKVTICHIPPGNPANAHTITISANALAAHMAHGDTTGICTPKKKIRVFLI